MEPRLDKRAHVFGRARALFMTSSSTINRKASACLAINYRSHHVHLSPIPHSHLRQAYRAHSHKAPQQTGFSLVELVMVIVLLGIVSASVLPRFFSKSDFDERILFDDTLNAARYAQKLSVATGCKTVLSISDNQYQLLQGSTCNLAPFTSPVTNPAKGGAYRGNQAGITLSATNITTTFNALGSADADNTVTVGARSFTIIAATGFHYDSTP